MRTKQFRIAKLVSPILILAIAGIMATPMKADAEKEETQDVVTELAWVKQVEEKEISEPEMETEHTVEIIVKFNDESEEYPFEGHETTIQEWADVPKWEIPQAYKDTGGCLPESVRVYLYNACKEKDISYPLMIALIEKESGYQWDATSPDGACKGYTMVSEKWHKNRMEELGVTDVYDPYGNIAISLDYLEELFTKYKNPSTVLMCYNCGESGAKELLAQGITSTSYSRKILQREAEIAEEMKE